GVGDGSDVVGNNLLTFGGNRLAQNELFTANGISMKIDYFGGTGNDVILTAIPEPGTVGALLCGVGSLLSMRLRRRREV
ncbi:MAG: PEP-CTERM sorting domain-containing protein, partial [Verrucomicrobiaceae bacterium]